MPRSVRLTRRSSFVDRRAVRRAKKALRVAFRSRSHSPVARASGRNGGVLALHEKEPRRLEIRRHPVRLRRGSLEKSACWSCP